MDDVYCYDCGAPCGTAGGAVPRCPACGPRWKLVRNAPCASVLVVDPPRILLSRRAIDPWAGSWELPGGFVDLGEHPATAAQREVREELGVEVALVGLLGTYLHDLPGIGECRQVSVFEARMTGGALRPDRAEVLDAAWFEIDDLPDDVVPNHRDRIDDWRRHGPVRPGAGLLGAPAGLAATADRPKRRWRR